MDVERTIDFILDQQAKIAAAQVGLQADLTDLKGSVGRPASSFQRLLSLEEGTLSIGFKPAKRMDESAVLHASRRGPERLAEARSQTEGNLNALISIVDGIIRPQPPAKPT